MDTLKREAITLLKQGKSYPEVCQRLKIAKSTLSNWFSALSDDEKNVIRSYRKNNWRKSVRDYQEKTRKKTLTVEKNIQEKHSKDISNISKEKLLLIGTALYWAEGSKSSRWQIQFSNSDPEMIKLIVRYFVEICHVPRNKLYMQMILHQNTHEEKCLDYWSGLTQVPKNQFKKACYAISKSSQQKRTKKKLPHGTLQIRVLDKKITHKVYGYILGLKKQTSIDI